ncbi:hypothetical protein TcBrA4_0004630 [Trypanosoma cruzi]|nr:hypothetical protein TcBrA4_0004630 [Trypanosoma cruzi]
MECRRRETYSGAARAYQLRSLPVRGGQRGCERLRRLHRAGVGCGGGEAQLTGHFHGRAGVSALCRVGVTMWSGDNDGRVIAWKLNTCEALRVLHAHGGRVASLRKIGSRVYSGGADGIIAVFDAEDCQLVQRIEDHRGARITALVGPAELRRFCIWSCGTDSKIRCWFQDEYVP